jgi:NADH-quinone oxidoreductase subunit J
VNLLATTTVPDAVTFAICAVVVLSGGIGVVTSRNPVHAALSLVMTLFGVAVLFIEQHAYFLAAVQVIVYAGAIVVLFLFVIMFLGVDREEDVHTEPLHGQRPLALVLVAISLAGVLALSATANWVTGAHKVTGGLTAGHHTDTFLLGKSIFTTYLWAFEITAALLVIAVVGAVVLARRPSPARDEDVRPPATEADGGLVPAGAAGAEETAASDDKPAGSDEPAAGTDGHEKVEVGR